MSTTPLFDLCAVRFLEDSTVSQIVRAARENGAVRVQVRPGGHAEAKLRRLFGERIQAIAPGLYEIVFGTGGER